MAIIETENLSLKRILIITYYWPPTGGSGVQRWLKFAKYLPQFGWQPVIYTPENPEAPVIDNSLLRDIPAEAIIIKQPIWEPYNIYKFLSGKKKDEKISAGFLSEKKKAGFIQKLSVWLRGNFLIPDPRKFWIKPSVKYLEEYLKTHPVEAIITTGPPHSMHIIGLHLKRKTNIKWIADFRDPWTNIDFYKELNLSAFADKQHHTMEMEVLAEADTVLTIGNTMKEEFEEMLRKNNSFKAGKVKAITNGYDEDDVKGSEISLDEKFSIAHIGTLTPSRNPHVLWKALQKLTKENTEFANDLQIKFVGKVDANVSESLQKAGLDKYVNKIEYLDHDKVIDLQCRSQVLLLLINNTPNSKGILTGKFFEYMSAQRPILCIGPADGDAAAILNETQSGKISGYEDVSGLKKNIMEFYTLYKQKQLFVNSKGIEKYSRKNLTKELSDLINY